MKSSTMKYIILTLLIPLGMCFARNQAYLRLLKNIDENLPIGLVVRTLDSDHHLTLIKPDSSILAPKFKLTLVDHKDGQSHFQDATPSINELVEAEKNVYVDQREDAAIILGNQGRKIQIKGHIGHNSIEHVDDQHFTSEQTVPRYSDYVDAGRNLTSKPGQVHAHTGGEFKMTDPITLLPELAIVIDYANYLNFKGDSKALIEYVSLMINSVNNRFANIPGEPRIRFALTGIHVISSPDAQPFISSSIIPSRDTYDIRKILEGFSKWVYSNTEYLPKHDLASLVTAVRLENKGDDGNYVDGVCGIAYVQSACWINGASNMGVSVTFDAGGAYAGVSSLTHELAHNLGSKHDGEEDNASCPPASGYIMSPDFRNGNGKSTKFFFSDCSIERINSFVKSADAACLQDVHHSTTQLKLPESNPGDYMNMSTQCQLALNNSRAFVDLTESPDSLCKNLRCKYPDAVNPNVIWWMNFTYPPADGAYCGESGSCKNGICVVQPNMTSQCQLALRNGNAFVDNQKAPNSFCSNLACNYPDPTNINRLMNVSLNKPPLAYSPCGRKGRCINGICQQPTLPTIPPSMTSQCQSVTGNPKAYVEPGKSPNELCSNLRCRYPYPDDTTTGGYQWITYPQQPTQYTPCGTNGNCLDGKCRYDVV